MCNGLAICVSLGVTIQSSICKPTCCVSRQSFWTPKNFLYSLPAGPTQKSPQVPKQPKPKKLSSEYEWMYEWMKHFTKFVFRWCPNLSQSLQSQFSTGPLVVGQCLDTVRPESLLINTLTAIYQAYPTTFQLHLGVQSAACLSWTCRWTKGLFPKAAEQRLQWLLSGSQRSPQDLKPTRSETLGVKCYGRVCSMIWNVSPCSVESCNSWVWLSLCFGVESNAKGKCLFVLVTWWIMSATFKPPKNDLAWSLMFAKRLPLQDQHRRAQMVLSRKLSWTHHRLSPQKPRAKALPRKGFERWASFWGKAILVCGFVGV